MFLDGENATSVSKEGTSPEPAETVEKLSAGGEPGATAIEASASSSETSVSADSFESRVLAILDLPAGIAAIVKATEAYFIAHPPTIGIAQMEELDDRAGLRANNVAQEAIAQFTKVDFPSAIDAAKADILAHLTPLIKAVVAGSAPSGGAAIATAPQAAAPHIFAVGDPAKVWADPQHKAFREGEIVAIHDDAHAFDVKLDDGTIAKIVADGLEYDSRK